MHYIATRLAMAAVRPQADDTWLDVTDPDNVVMYERDFTGKWVPSSRKPPMPRADYTIAPNVNGGDGDELQVRSIFATIQGEGPFSGRRATFIRLTGCNLRCFWCDTEWSDTGDARLSLDEIMGRVRNVNFAYSNANPLVVITGGEPVRQPLGPLLNRLTACGCDVQIETAGTLWQPVLEFRTINGRALTIVCSPKTPRIHPYIFARADAFKYVLRHGEVSLDDMLPSRSTQIPGAYARLRPPREGAPVYVTPCDTGDERLNARNRETVAEAAKRHGYIAQVQIHKLMGVP